MPLAMGQIMAGAFVEEALDDKGRLRKVRRRGYITKVIHQNGEEYGSDGVKEVWVKYDEDRPAELAKSEHLNLVRAYDQVAAGRIKQERDNALGTRVVEDRRAVVQNRTGIESKEPFTEETLPSKLKR